MLMKQRRGIARPGMGVAGLPMHKAQFPQDARRSSIVMPCTRRQRIVGQCFKGLRYRMMGRAGYDAFAMMVGMQVVAQIAARHPKRTDQPVMQADGPDKSRALVRPTSAFGESQPAQAKANCPAAV